MGATNIHIKREGELTKNEILEAFQAQKVEDRFNNGHQDGYSGDFQTVNQVKFDVLDDELNVPTIKYHVDVATVFPLQPVP